MADPKETDDGESQDLAETFDEENITSDGRDIATSDMQPDVFDVTTTAEDADLDEALAPQDDFDPDQMDEAEYEEVLMAEEDLDEPRSFAPDNADRVSDGDLQPQDLEAESLDDQDLEALGYEDQEALERNLTLDERLDEGLEETFPASDPVSINPGSD